MTVPLWLGLLPYFTDVKVEQTGSNAILKIQISEDQMAP